MARKRDNSKKWWILRTGLAGFDTVYRHGWDELRAELDAKVTLVQEFAIFQASDGMTFAKSPSTQNSIVLKEEPICFGRSS